MSKNNNDLDDIRKEVDQLRKNKNSIEVDKNQAAVDAERLRLEAERDQLKKELAIQNYNKSYSENIQAAGNTSKYETPRPSFPPRAIPESDVMIPKKTAALEVLRWLNTIRVLSVAAMCAPFCVLMLDWIELFEGSFIVLAASISIIAFMLRKAEVYRRYIEVTYNIKPNVPKPSRAKKNVSRGI